MSLGAERWASWNAVLDRLEGDVETLYSALAADQPVELTAWEPPADLGPPPADLQPRARELVARLQAAQQRAARHLGVLSGELTQLDRRRGAGQAYAVADAPATPTDRTA